jgi:hypothetical protein
VRTKSFHEKKSTCRLACAKNKNGAKNKAFYDTFLSIFYTDYKKYIFFNSIHDCGDAHAKYGFCFTI